MRGLPRLTMVLRGKRRSLYHFLLPTAYLYESHGSKNCPDRYGTGEQFLVPDVCSIKEFIVSKFELLGRKAFLESLVNKNSL